MSASTPTLTLPILSSQADKGLLSSLAQRVVRHPHFVLRIGGEPINVLRSLDSVQAASAADQSALLKIAKADAIARACAAIENIVPAISDTAAKRGMIRLKRDLFNARPLRADAIAALRPLLDVGVTVALDAAITSIERHHAAQMSVKEAYHADMAVSSAALRHASERPNLRAALISSSAPLVQALRKVEDGKALSPKDWSNLNLALAGFVTRATMKTSPRSSLTIVATGMWDDNGATSPYFEINQPTVLRDVRIRHSVLERLLLPPVRDADMLSADAPVTVNETLRFGGDAIEWQRIAYTENPEMETFGIVSTTNKLRLRPAIIDALVALAASGPQTLNLCHKLLQQRFGGDAQAAHQLLHKLISLDLLVLDNPWPLQGDKLGWASSLAHRMRPEIAEAVGTSVRNLAQASEAMASTGPQTELRQLVEHEIQALASELGNPVRAVDLRPVFYEDCRIETPSLAMSEEALSFLRNDLVSLLSLLPLLRGYGWAAAWLTSRFVATFGASGCCDDPLAFLGGTAEALAAANGGSDAAPPWQTGTVPDDPNAHEQNLVSARFAEALREHNRGATDWTVPSSLVAQFYAMLPLSYRRRARSHCINGQLASVDGGSQFILNSVYPGNGRMTSRFLQSSRDAAAYVRAIAPGEPISIPGVFGFNANVHPPLSARELVIPPYPSEYAETGKVQLAQCRLRHDPGLNRVVVEGPDGERLSPFYFGILNSWALPPVHRALDWMNGASDLPFTVPDAIVSRERPVEPPTIWVRPRIVMGNIVLGRRAWSVASAGLPDPTLDDAAFFLALRETWRALGLPRIVFFQASNFWRAGRAGASRPSKTRKPMYLDTDNVWLVKAFARALRATAGHLVFTECLPELGDTPLRVDGEAHSAEITLELGLRQTDV